MADDAQPKAWIGTAVGELGGLDLPVCNASALVPGNSEDASTQMFASEVMGVQRATSAAPPQLEAAAA